MKLIKGTGHYEWPRHPVIGRYFAISDDMGCWYSIDPRRDALDWGWVRPFTTARMPKKMMDLAARTYEVFQIVPWQ